ncbi:class I SAM-dependent methyltransferase [Kitasatospora cystarginea]|uniref:class I SAM-dependent methyltransferase n=1 Tax=Kitasatospora cystarginea TaxID=58350 RepID=UPI0031D01DD0
MTFRQGRAEETGLPDGSADIVFERALVHHLDDLPTAFREARRVLAPGGTLIVQDRTIEDVRRPGSADHLRGWFFEFFPGLLEPGVRRPGGGPSRPAGPHRPVDTARADRRPTDRAGRPHHGPAAPGADPRAGPLDHLGGHLLTGRAAFLFTDNHLIPSFSEQPMAWHARRPGSLPPTATRGIGPGLVCWCWET